MVNYYCESFNVQTDILKYYKNHKNTKKYLKNVNKESNTSHFIFRDFTTKPLQMVRMFIEMHLKQHDDTF